MAKPSAIICDLLAQLINSAFNGNDEQSEPETAFVLLAVPMNPDNHGQVRYASNMERPGVDAFLRMVVAQLGAPAPPETVANSTSPLPTPTTGDIGHG